MATKAPVTAAEIDGIRARESSYRHNCGPFGHIEQQQASQAFTDIDTLLRAIAERDAELESESDRHPGRTLGVYMRKSRSFQSYVFIDCEFNGWRGELISMALVSQCGREFYMAMIPTQILDPWVKENVIPVLQTEPCEQSEFTSALQCYLNSFDAIQLFADWPDDIKYFFDCLVVGPGEKIKTPPIAAHIRDWMHSRDSVVPHNALHDARAIREVYRKQIGWIEQDDDSKCLARDILTDKLVPSPPAKGE